MAIMALCYQNRVLGATITASTSATNLGAANLQQPALSPQIWQSTTTPSWVKFDFLASYTISAVALLGTNLTPAATMRIRLSANTALTSPTYDSGVVTAGIDVIYRNLIKVLPAPAAGQFLQIDLTDGSLPFHSAGVGAAMSGGFRPTRGFAYGYAWTWLDSTQIDVSETGQSWIEAGVNRRELRLKLHALTDAEANGEFATIAAFGRWRDVLVVLDPALTIPAPMAIYGPIVQNFSADHPFPNLHTADLVIQERR